MPAKKRSVVRQKFGHRIGESFRGQILTLKERNRRCNALAQYLDISTPDVRRVPGFESPLSYFQRVQEGTDCDEVADNLILGNAATLKKKPYLRRIGVTHVLNAAERCGVNVDRSFFDGEFEYKGLRVEDTPQTQICR